MSRWITAAGNRRKSSRRHSGYRLYLNMEILFQLIGTVLQLILGFSVVCAAILGLIRPFWLATFFSILGSGSVVAGIISLYRLFISRHVFDSLVNRAIRRVIQSQN
ncbi:MAG: hypothetical protein WEC12_07725 [Balneolaceae bacterium]